MEHLLSAIDLVGNTIGQALDSDQMASRHLQGMQECNLNFGIMESQYCSPNNGLSDKFGQGMTGLKVLMKNVCRHFTGSSTAKGANVEQT